MTQTFTGKLGIGDMQRHIPHQFEVPPGTTQIDIRFDFTPRHPGIGPRGHEISLSLFDPETCRGARHNNADQTICLTHTTASLGYTPGPITPGTWSVNIDTHRILPPGDVTYALEVDLSAAPVEAAADHFPPAQTDPREPGWFRGDLHGHSHHSDAPWSVRDFTDYARSIGLDFVTLSDHNTVSGLPEARMLAGDDLLVIGGMELSTFWGHALAFGNDAWVDWRVQDGQTMRDVAAAHEAQGATFIIAHPMNVGHPYCSGCLWQYIEMMPGPAKLVEVWNSGWSGSSNNDMGLQLFYGWISAGRKLALTAGSDVHGPFRGQRPGYNHVYAEGLTEGAILKAVRQGRNYLSSGPHIRLVAETTGEEDAMMGDVLASHTASLKLEWWDCPENSEVRILRKGPSEDCVEVVTRISPSTSGAHEARFEARGDWDWVTVEIRDETNALHAVANPIFFGTSQED